MPPRRVIPNADTAVALGGREERSSGEKASALTGPVAFKLASKRSLVVSHKRTTDSREPAVARTPPDGENASEMTPPCPGGWAWNVEVLHRREQSQNVTTPEESPTAKCLPSGEKARALIPPRRDVETCEATAVFPVPD